MVKTKFKKIGIIAMGVLTLISTSLSVVAIVKVTRGHHAPPCPPPHMQEDRDHNHGAPRGECDPRCPEDEHGSRDRKHAHNPKDPEEKKSLEDEHDHNPMMDDKDPDAKAHDTNKNLEDKKDQPKKY